MINNNTPQKDNVIIGSTSESTIYLKKSELPKNISAFKNDANYISTTALSDWLKKHSYLSKSEVNTLIEKANLVVIDSVKNATDNEAIKRLEDYINSINGEIVEIKEHLKNLSSQIVDVESGSISVEKEKDFATQTDIKDMSDKIDKINYVLSGVALKDWIESQGYLTEHQDLTGYAKESWVKSQGYLTKHQDLSEYASKVWVEENFHIDLPDLSGYAKKSDIPTVPTKVSQLTNDKGYLTKHQDLSDYAKKSEIPSIGGLASQDWVKSQGYLTRHQSLIDYAKKSEIPSVDGLASKVWVEENFHIDLPDLDEYAKKSDIPNVPTKVSQLTNDKGYLTKHQDLSGYATKDWVEEQKYLTEHQDLTGYATKDWVNSKGFVLQSKLNNTLNGYAKVNDVYTKESIDSKFMPANEVRSTYMPKDDINDTFISKREAEKKYLSQTEAANAYLAIEDYRGLKDATTISVKYREKTIDELENDIDILMNGFYIVHYNDIVIVKDHQIVNMFKDGVPQTILEWKEEED